MTATPPPLAERLAAELAAIGTLRPPDGPDRRRGSRGTSRGHGGPPPCCLDAGGECPQHEQVRRQRQRTGQPINPHGRGSGRC